MQVKWPILCGIALFPLFSWGLPATSQTESPDSTFKRIKVENRPAGSKINIQIDPDEQAALLAPPDAPIDTTLIEDRIQPVIQTPAAKDLQNWFWDDLGDTLQAASGDRMNLAVRQMAKAPTGFYQPRAQHLNTLASEFGAQILMASLDTKVSPALILAVMGVESAGKVDATSSAGAKGLMQLIPETAERFGVTDITDPAQNIAGGVAYLDWLLKEFEYDPLLALAGYNAGENAVKKNNGIPDYAETRAYVPKVVAAWQVARNLCSSPPLLVSEPCVFKIQTVPSKTGSPKN